MKLSRFSVRSKRVAGVKRNPFVGFRTKGDKNHNAIANGLRAFGFFVVDLRDVGNGVVDLCALNKQGAATWLEVKTKTGRVRKSQKKFAQLFPAPVHVVRTIDDALRACGVRISRSHTESGISVFVEDKFSA